MMHIVSTKNQALCTRQRSHMTGNDLVLQWLPFAKKIAWKEGLARRFRGDFRDLEQAAVEGLCRARDSFDPDRGAFSTHAGYEVLAAVQAELKRHGLRKRSTMVTISLPRHLACRRGLIPQIEAREMLRLVDHELRRMPDRWSSLILGVRVNGGTATSVGHVRGVSPQAVSKQLDKAHSRLMGVMA